MTEEVNRTGTIKSLTQRQRNAIDYYWEHRETIFDVLWCGCSVQDKMLFLVSLPGFGIPKAGFVLQCLIGSVGCLDVHNLKRFELDAKDFSSHGSRKSTVKRIAHYVALCQESFGCAYLWDSWCALIAEKYPHKYTDANHVSRLHVDCIIAS